MSELAGNFDAIDSTFPMPKSVLDGPFLWAQSDLYGAQVFWLMGKDLMDLTEQLRFFGARIGFKAQDRQGGTSIPADDDALGDGFDLFDFSLEFKGSKFVSVAQYLHIIGSTGDANRFGDIGCLF